MPEFSELCFKNKCSYICCRKPVVTDSERKLIIKKLKIGLFKRYRLFRRIYNGLYLINGQQCPFLKDGKCTIEDIKPLTCRIYPLVIIFNHGMPEWGLDKECPAVPHLSKDFIEKAKKEGKPLLKIHKDIFSHKKQK